MSKKSYNNYGVPWYAPPSTPAIRPAATYLPTSEYIEMRARRMRELAELRKQIRAQWSEGDVFCLNGRVGEFEAIRLIGHCWAVLVKRWLYSPDSSENVRRIGLREFMEQAELICRASDVPQWTEKLGE